MREITIMVALLLTGLYFLCKKEGPWKMICVPNVILLCLLISLKQLDNETSKNNLFHTKT